MPESGRQEQQQDKSIAKLNQLAGELADIAALIRRLSCPALRPIGPEFSSLRQAEFNFPRLSVNNPCSHSHADNESCEADDVEGSAHFSYLRQSVGLRPATRDRRDWTARLCTWLGTH